MGKNRRLIVSKKNQKSHRIHVLTGVRRTLFPKRKRIETIQISPHRGERFSDHGAQKSPVNKKADKKGEPHHPEPFGGEKEKKFKTQSINTKRIGGQCTLLWLREWDNEGTNIHGKRLFVLEDTRKKERIAPGKGGASLLQARRKK